MRMRDLFTITEDEGTAPIGPSAKPRSDSYQSKPERRTRSQSGASGRMQAPSPAPKPVKKVEPVAPVDPA